MNNAHMFNDKLFVKGSLQVQYLPPTLPDPDPDSEHIDVTSAEECITEQGSTFRGYCAIVKSPEDISAAEVMF